MATILIRNASLFSPDPLGTNDILIINDRIAAIAQNVSVPEWLGPVQEMDGKGLFAVPGFIDAHVHITGGGGEAGFSSQVPPLPLSKLIRSGVTTVGGLLGTDGVTRHVDAVLAKANSLEEEGVSSFIMSGGYPVPSPTLTGSIRSDIAFIEKVRGGKIAIADHRVAPVSAETLLAVATEARVGGMLRGFIGMLIMHIGAAAEGLSCVFAALERAPHLGRHLIATHINRSSFAFPKLPNCCQRRLHGYFFRPERPNPRAGHAETIGSHRFSHASGSSQGTYPDEFGRQRQRGPLWRRRQCQRACGL